MRAIYGYDVAADLQPGCRYDEVVRALGGAGELVTAPGGIAPALRRAFASGVPYLVNVVTDPEIAYPRSTTQALHPLAATAVRSLGKTPETADNGRVRAR